jgi:hypothetical protein
MHSAMINGLLDDKQETMCSFQSSGIAGSKSIATTALPSFYNDTLAHKLPVLSIYNKYPIYLTEDWNSGIGGGLWSTGLAMANYFCTKHFQTRLERMRYQRRLSMTTDIGDPPLRVLELGSGNGFLSTCLVVAAMMRRDDTCRNDIEEASSFLAFNKDPIPVHVTTTDTADHLSLMKTTIESNLKRISAEAALQRGQALNLSQYVTVQEYIWGETTTEKDLTRWSEFDLIIGSDLAYREELHDPLIAALQKFYGNVSTNYGPVTLLGVTMTDTKPIFFQKLIQSKFRYEKLADHLLQAEFRGSGSRQFGIFVIYR